ncbi:prostatic spermine-binding protein-like [Protopterus annectens]|uniref:prostatic spermine-binding protein-like n=1 Tax=Protopterus annectens TaxID=7888 RepID=UPI001CFB1FEA|nr:prostatic spermine-binding protein-like [Protopterus annectens]
MGKIQRKEVKDIKKKAFAEVLAVLKEEEKERIRTDVTENRSNQVKEMVIIDPFKVNQGNRYKVFTGDSLSGIVTVELPFPEVRESDASVDDGGHELAHLGVCGDYNGGDDGEDDDSEDYDGGDDGEDDDSEDYDGGDDGEDDDSEDYDGGDDGEDDDSEYYDGGDDGEDDDSEDYDGGDDGEDDDSEDYDGGDDGEDDDSEDYDGGDDGEDDDSADLHSCSSEPVRSE